LNEHTTSLSTGAEAIVVREGRNLTVRDFELLAERLSFTHKRGQQRRKALRQLTKAHEASLRMSEHNRSSATHYRVQYNKLFSETIALRNELQGRSRKWNVNLTVPDGLSSFGILSIGFAIGAWAPTVIRAICG
jgi:hypothetical protein